MDAIRRVFEELNLPSQTKPKLALKKRRIPFADEKVKQVVTRSEAKQLIDEKKRSETQSMKARLWPRRSTNAGQWTW